MPIRLGAGNQAVESNRVHPSRYGPPGVYIYADAAVFISQILVRCHHAMPMQLGPNQAEKPSSVPGCYDPRACACMRHRLYITQNLN